MKENVSLWIGFRRLWIWHSVGVLWTRWLTLYWGFISFFVTDFQYGFSFILASQILKCRCCQSTDFSEAAFFWSVCFVFVGAGSFGRLRPVTSYSSGFVDHENLWAVGEYRLMWFYPHFFKKIRLEFFFKAELERLKYFLEILKLCLVPISSQKWNIICLHSSKE